MPVDVDVVEVRGHRLESGWVDVLDLAPARRAVIVGECADYADPIAVARFRAGLLAVAGMDLPVPKILSRMDGFVGECGIGLPVSLSYAVIDGIRSVVTVANAGAPPALVISRDGVRPLVESVAPPLGIGSPVLSVNAERIPLGSVLAFSTTPFLASASSSSSQAHQLADLVRERPADELATLAPALQRAARGSHAAMALVRVSGGRDVMSARVAPAAREARAVRRVIADTAALWPAGERLAAHALELVATELFANAMTRSSSMIEILLAMTGSGALVEVSDSSSDVPLAIRVPHTEPDGRGMVLVADLCSRWGTRWEGDGKVVWAEVPWPTVQARDEGLVV